MQLKTIAQKEFDVERLPIMRDIFLFCCFSGLAYAYIKKITRTEITDGADREK